MKIKGIITSSIIFLSIYTLLLPVAGCQKELYFDRVDSTVIDPVPVPSSALTFPLCPLCNASIPLKENEWSFKTVTSYLCGTLTDGIITANKNAFTFFGPSACSIDSGLVITAYLEPARLTGDTTNVHSTGVAFYYYDHNSADYILVSRHATGFNLTIDKYVQATGIATGTFNGGSFRANGDFVDIGEGKFTVKLRR